MSSILVLRWFCLLVAALALLLVSPDGLGASATDPEGWAQENSFVRLLSSSGPQKEGGILRRGAFWNTQLVGSNAIGGRGFNADVWVHENFAYVGQWGFGFPPQPQFCPSGTKSGVKVLDVSDPAHPQVVATLQNPPLTTAEDIVVYTQGGRDIAAVGIQACFRLNPSIFRGLQLFDVTDPVHPVEISRLSSGLFARGVHELSITQRADLGKTLALLAVPFSEARDQDHKGDFRIVDITDAAHPMEIADWGIKKNLGQPTGLGVGQGTFRARFDHSAEANADGTRAFLSYWDFGVVILDIEDPTTPVFLGRTTYPANADGDGHSVAIAQGEGFLLLGDEDFDAEPARHTEKGWGFLRVFDITNPAAPVQRASFKTARSQTASNISNGDYSIHNPFVWGDRAYLSWYSDGVRVLNFSNPAAPTEIAYFIPPGVKDPLHLLPHTAVVWGVVVAHVAGEDLAFVSDMNAGLYIFRVTAP